MFALRGRIATLDERNVSLNGTHTLIAMPEMPPDAANDTIQRILGRLSRGGGHHERKDASALASALCPRGRHASWHRVRHAMRRNTHEW